jgi:hypothetical protein
MIRYLPWDYRDDLPRVWPTQLTDPDNAFLTVQPYQWELEAAQVFYPALTYPTSVELGHQLGYFDFHLVLESDRRLFFRDQNDLSKNYIVARFEHLGIDPSAYYSDPEGAQEQLELVNNYYLWYREGETYVLPKWNLGMTLLNRTLEPEKWDLTVYMQTAVYATPYLMNVEFFGDCIWDREGASPGDFRSIVYRPYFGYDFRTSGY